MKAFGFLSRSFALRGLWLFTLIASAAWLHGASAGITDKITGRSDMAHYFRGPSGDAAKFAVNKGYYALVSINYGGYDIMKNNKYWQGPRRFGFGGFTTPPLPWYQTITVKIEVYRESTNQKIDTFNWSGKLAMAPGVGFTYYCKDDAQGVTPFSAGLNFTYEKGTDPAAPAVNVYVK